MIEFVEDPFGRVIEKLDERGLMLPCCVVPCLALVGTLEAFEVVSDVETMRGGTYVLGTPEVNEILAVLDAAAEDGESWPRFPYDCDPRLAYTALRLVAVRRKGDTWASYSSASAAVIGTISHSGAMPSAAR